MSSSGGKWSGLLALTILATSSYAQLAQTSDVVISDLMSTSHTFENFMEVTDPQLAFKPGQPLLKSVDATGDQPAKVGFSIDDSQQFQTIEHIGASITDATGITLADVRQANPDVYCEILNMLFSQKEEWLRVGGVGMTSARHPLGGSDFSLQYYTLDDPQKCGAEFKGDLEYFNLAASSPKLWQVLLDVKEIVEAEPSDSLTPRANFSTRALPWTANPAAKTSKSYVGEGRLEPQWEKYWVEYFRRSVKELCQLGVCPEYVSIQESPQHKDDIIPSMQVRTDQAVRLAQGIRQAIDQDEEIQSMYQGKPPLKLAALEASWGDTDFRYADRELSAGGDYFGAVAFQGYTGYNATNQEKIFEKYNKKILFTEMTETLTAEPWGNLRDFVFKVGVNAIQRQTSDVNMWQSALRTNNDMSETSPSLPGACKNCLANLLILPKATQGYHSQTHTCYSKEDDPHPDWLQIDDKIANLHPLTLQQAESLNAFKPKSDDNEDMCTVLRSMGLVDDSKGGSSSSNGNIYGNIGVDVGTGYGTTSGSTYEGVYGSGSNPGGNGDQNVYPGGNGRGQSLRSNPGVGTGMNYKTGPENDLRRRQVLNPNVLNPDKKATDQTTDPDPKDKKTGGATTDAKDGKTTGTTTTDAKDGKTTGTTTTDAKDGKTTGDNTADGQPKTKGLSSQEISANEKDTKSGAGITKTANGVPLPPDQCFQKRGLGFKYEPTRCSSLTPPPKAGRGIYGPGGNYARTSQMDFVGHLGYATKARKGWGQGVRIGITSTDSPGEQDVINGKVMGTAFEQVMFDNSGSPGPQSRFCLLMLNWNDNDQKKFEPVDTVISFRGQVTELRTDPGVYTACWIAESSKSYYAKNPKPTNQLPTTDKVNADGKSTSSTVTPNNKGTGEQQGDTKADAKTEGGVGTGQTGANTGKLGTVPDNNGVKQPVINSRSLGGFVKRVVQRK